MKKIAYIANVRLPTEKAHGIQIMEMCSAFADAGVEAELVVPSRENSIKDDPFSYHDVKRNFSIRYLACIDLFSLGKFGYRLSLVFFALSVILGVANSDDAVFYTRDEFLAFILSLTGRSVIWEGHTGQKNFIVKALIRSKVKFITITDALRQLYVSMGVPDYRIIVAPDGADISRFDISKTKAEARKELNLPINKKIILYKGHLYERKGAHTLALSAECLKDKNVICVFIGGTEMDVADFKKRFGNLDNVLVLGNRPRQETPIYQRASDVLVIPNSAKDDVSKLYTSPMKLFGYMASGVPIVASDLPALREVVDESLVTFFVPDDPASLCGAINSVLSDYNSAEEKAHKTFELAKNYSWQKRAQNIIDFIKLTSRH